MAISWENRNRIFWTYLSIAIMQRHDHKGILPTMHIPYVFSVSYLMHFN